MLLNPQFILPNGPLVPSIFGFQVTDFITGFGQYSFPIPTIAGGITNPVRGVGPTWIADQTDNIVYGTARRPFVLTVDSQFTFVIVSRWNGTAANFGCIAGYGATGGGPGNTQFNVVPSATQDGIKILIQDSAANIYYNADSTACGYLDGRYHVAVIACSAISGVGDTCTYYVDGVELNTMTKSITAMASTTFDLVNVCTARRGGANIIPGCHDVAMFAVIAGKLSREQAIRLSMNPLLMYPKLDIKGLFAAAAVGGTTFQPQLTMMGVG